MASASPSLCPACSGGSEAREKEIRSSKFKSFHEIPPLSLSDGPLGEIVFFFRATAVLTEPPNLETGCRPRWSAPRGSYVIPRHTFPLTVEKKGLREESSPLDKSKRCLFEIPINRHQEIEAELKMAVAPPNGRVVLVFRVR
ncbi:hypothetical protein CRG98_045537 [Punica granatum]|uniref:Uncharacterized protein n=1 Tax=Punica granatum TaxID=22663 RepID=A0A2I0HRJ4_PUNGR|nr:hypothetical protein CRG98_045537 [Punica granatum]